MSTDAAVRPPEPPFDVRVVINFFRDVRLSNQAFWDQIPSDPAQPRTVYMFGTGAAGTPAQLQGRWIVDLNVATGQLQAVAEGARDDWSSVESTADGFVAEYGDGPVHLAGHDATAALTYLDAGGILRSIGALSASDEGPVTLELTDQEDMRTVTRALALVDGGTSLRLTLDAPSTRILRVDRFVGDQLCESAAASYINS